MFSIFFLFFVSFETFRKAAPKVNNSEKDAQHKLWPEIDSLNFLKTEEFYNSKIPKLNSSILKSMTPRVIPHSMTYIQNIGIQKQNIIPCS